MQKFKICIFWRSKKNNCKKLIKLKGCVTGGVPPFGSIFKIPSYVDMSLIEQGNEISFNAGLRTKSVIFVIIKDSNEHWGLYQIRKSD